MEKAADLELRRAIALAGGREELVACQHAKGKLTARERIELLLDEGSFEEFEGFSQHDCNRFDVNERKLPENGVVAGSGTVNGRPLFVFSQDITVFGGSMSQAQAERICRLMDRAITMKAPVAGLYDSLGANIQEGTAAFAGYAEIAQCNIVASGVVPQISLIMGPCVGAAAFSPAITDFTFAAVSYTHLTLPTKA